MRLHLRQIGSICYPNSDGMCVVQLLHHTTEVLYEVPDCADAFVSLRDIFPYPACDHRFVHNVPHGQTRLRPQRLHQVAAVRLAGRPEVGSQPLHARIGNPFVLGRVVGGLRVVEAGVPHHRHHANIAVVGRAHEMSEAGQETLGIVFVHDVGQKWAGAVQAQPLGIGQLPFDQCFVVVAPERDIVDSRTGRVIETAQMLIAFKKFH